MVNLIDENTIETDAYHMLNGKEYKISVFRLDVAKVKRENKEYQFFALRMPNGDLSRDALKIFCAAGFSHIRMCGANQRNAGSTKVGEHVALKSSIHNGESLL